MTPTEVRWRDELSKLLSPPQVLCGPAVERAYECDSYTIERSYPSIVVLPETTEQVADIVKWCNKNKVPFTPRGAGTGLSGGAMPAFGGVVISTKRMTRILAIEPENYRLKAQTGAVNLNITKSVSPLGLHFAPDPSSQSVATLGGNIAENSGGPHTLKYGVTAPHVLEVTMVDVSGNICTFERSPTIDFVSLIVGSEGTLGVVTEAWVRLTPLPESVETVLVAFPKIKLATEAVSAIIAAGILPAALEMMDQNILSALKAAFQLEFPEGSEALLLIECDGEREETRLELERLLETVRSFSPLSIQVAQSEAERQKLWTARKKGIGAMGRLAPSIVTHDGVIPRSKLPEMLELVYSVAEEAGVGVANLFHAGDGNLHPCFYFDDRDPVQVEAVVKAGEKIIQKCVEMGGSVTGEHGVGVEKSGLLKHMYTDEDLEFQSDMKSAFNSGQLCNPCKILPDQKGCVEHIWRRRGGAAT